MTRLNLDSFHLVFPLLRRFLKISNFLTNDNHLGYWARSPDTILEEEHPRIIASKIGSIWPRGTKCKKLMDGRSQMLEGKNQLKMCTQKLSISVLWWFSICQGR